MIWYMLSLEKGRERERERERDGDRDTDRHRQKQTVSLKNINKKKFPKMFFSKKKSKPIEDRDKVRSVPLVMTCMVCLVV